MSLLAAVPSRGRVTRKGTALPVPAPVMGWNVRDAWAVMDPRFAIQLDNWFPEADSVRLRNGYEEHCPSLGDLPKTLYGYDFQGTQKLVAFTDSKIIDATASSASDLATGLSDGFWSTATHGGYGIFVNGTDTPRKYDGSSVTTTAFTGSGLTPTNLFGVHSHKNRLYLWEDDSTSFWYAGTDAIAGTLNEFDLQYVHQTKGKIIALGTWTFDGGSGVDDVLVIVFSSGQVFVYSGSDPGDANDWSLVGTFDIGGRPLGRRCVTQYGGDLILLTENGYFPVSKALSLGNVSSAVTVSDVINGAVTELARTNASDLYWQILLRGGESMLVVNVPSVATPGGYDQHVMNTRTGAWCRFTGWNALCFAELDGELYFGASDENTVFKADTGTNDDGADIECIGQSAFTNLGQPGGLKKWNMVRPILRIDSGVDVSLGMAIDYGDVPGFAAISSVPQAGVEWDSDDAIWDVAEWAAEGQIQRVWQSVNGIGYSASVVLKIATQNAGVRWYETTHLVEPGGLM